MPTDGAQDKTEYVNPANLIKFCHFTSYYTTGGGGRWSSINYLVYS